MKSRRAVVSFATGILLLFAGNLFAQEPAHHHHEGEEKVGSVSFSNSCAPGVQAKFARGLALLYSFEYEHADQEFKAVAAADPQCAIAYWGQAMTLYHQLWSRPTPDQMKQGSVLIEKAQQLNPKTQRERDYINGLGLFYRGSNQADYEKRVQAYSDAMGKLSSAYPEDHEAVVLYALSLLGSENDDDLTLANQKKAVGILNALFQQQPDHPGIAHYIIHACDNPKMASMGLSAAREYAKIAPASPHATHMPSHIFARLGLWQDDIASNLAALDAAQKDAAMKMHVAHHQLHSIDFLEYAYLQVGDDTNAKAMMERAAGIRKHDLEEDLRDYYDYEMAHLPALYFLETRQWKSALALGPPEGTPPGARAITYWAHALAAGHLKDAEAARTAVGQFNAMVEAVRKSSRAYQAEGMSTDRDEATAWMYFAMGKTDEALKLLRAVADRQDKVGKGEVELPAREMVADMLLEINRPEEALAEHEKSLQTDPNRFNGLYGAAEAAEMTKHSEKASAYYAQLLKNCEGTNSDRRELARAKELMAKK